MPTVVVWDRNSSLLLYQISRESFPDKIIKKGFNHSEALDDQVPTGLIGKSLDPLNWDELLEVISLIIGSFLVLEASGICMSNQVILLIIELEIKGVSV